MAALFAWHVLWPTGATGGFDFVAAAIALAATLALFRFKMNVMHVIVASALHGLALRFLP